MGLRLDAAEPADAGIVHDNIEPALPPHRLIDERLHGQVIADIGFEGQNRRAGRGHPGQFSLGLLQVGASDPRNRHVDTAAQQCLSDGAADSTRPAGDDCNLARETRRHSEIQ